MRHISGSIRHKLFLAAFIVGLTLLSIAVFTYIESGKVQDLFELNQTLENSEKRMLHLRKDEKDFLSRNEARYVEQFEANYQLLMADLAHIQRSPLIDQEQVFENLRDLQGYLAAYRNAFLAISQMREEMGLTETLGLRGKLRQAVHDAEVAIKALGKSDLEVAMLTLRRHEKDFMLRSDVGYVTKHEQSIAVFQSLLAQADLDSASQQKISHFIQAYRAGFQALVQKSQQIGLSENDGVMGNMRQQVHQTEGTFDILLDLLEQTQKRFIVNLAWTLTAMLVAAVLFGVSMIVFIAISVSKRVNVVGAQLHNIAAGSANLSQRLDIKGHDEIAELSSSFNRFIGKLQNEFQGIQRVSRDLHSATEINAQLTEQARANATKQQEESSQAAVAAQQMAATAQEMAQNIETTAEQTNRVQAAVAQGHTVVQQTRLAIDELEKVIHHSSQAVTTVSEQTARIDSVVDVIQSIAEQTNLLALNAAIESARAGESGRGFAVVADEVRSLAQRTHDSTEEIQALIESLRNSVKDAVVHMQHSSEYAQRGVVSTSQVEDSLASITHAVEGIVSMSAQIAAGSTEQAQTADVMGHNISAISSLAEATLATVNSVDKEGEQLSRQSRELSDIVEAYI